MIKYFKFYLEPKRQDILSQASLAFEEWVSKDTSRKNMQNYQGFCRGYEDAYRHEYAKSKMKGGL